MTALEIRHLQFPGVIPDDARVGDLVTLIVTGRISRMEDDLIDVTRLGGRPEYVQGARETRIVVTGIREP